jgi:hypothetical protein
MTLKTLIRDRFVLPLRQRKKARADLAKWQADGYPVPPPQAYKQQVIKQLAGQFGVRTMIETGTYRGDTVAAALANFDTIYSIELADELFTAACARFVNNTKVKLHHGNSSTELPKILTYVQQPALFWLDAHYSGGCTACGDLETPIVRELETIAAHPISGHVILIDDAREFTGSHDYPTLTAFKDLAAKLLPRHTFVVAHDVIRLTPA